MNEQQSVINTFDDEKDGVQVAFPNVKQVKIEDAIIGRNIVVKKFVTREGEKGTYLIILATVEGSTEDVSFSCGSKTVNEIIQKLNTNNRLPIFGNFNKVKAKDSRNWYYTFGKPITPVNQ